MPSEQSLVLMLFREQRTRRAGSREAVACAAESPRGGITPPRRSPQSNGRLITVLHQLARLGVTDHLYVFGSVARGKPYPGDIDVVALHADTPFRSVEQHEPYTPLLRLAHRYYGSMDPFLRFSNRLLCRNDKATGWVGARNTRALWQQMRTTMRPLSSIPSLLKT